MIPNVLAIFVISRNT